MNIFKKTYIKLKGIYRIWKFYRMLKKMKREEVFGVKLEDED